MSDGNDIISTDNPLNDEQQARLAGLLDVIIPPSEDGRLPSAAELDLVAYVQTYAPEFLPALVQVLDDLDEQFASLERTERHALVEELSKSQAEVFGLILFNTFACYYQNDSVHKAIGMGEGPPFPRGNEVEPGDLSLLDPVLARPTLYRKTNP
jgi:hypothetical protein